MLSTRREPPPGSRERCSHVEVLRVRHVLTARESWRGAPEREQPVNRRQVPPWKPPLVLPLKALPVFPVGRPLVPAARRPPVQSVGEWVVPEKEGSARAAEARVRTACLSRRRSP
jgi:hypothetical protein